MCKVLQCAKKPKHTMHEDETRQLWDFRRFSWCTPKKSQKDTDKFGTPEIPTLSPSPCDINKNFCTLIGSILYW